MSVANHPYRANSSPLLKAGTPLAHPADEMERERTAAHTQVLPSVGTEYPDHPEDHGDGFDEFIDDGTDTGDWDEPDGPLSTTALLWIVAGLLAGVVALTFVMMNQMIAALPAPSSPRATVTQTQTATQVLTTAQTVTETTTATPTRERNRDRVTRRGGGNSDNNDTDNDSRADGGAGGRSARARPDQQRPESAKEPVEVTAPVPLPDQDAAGTLARSFSDGVVMAGRDVVEGTYRNSGGDGTCEWTFRKGSQVVDSGRTTSTFAIDLAADGVVFISRGCGTWTVQN